MLELIQMGENLKRAAPAEICALLEYCAVYGGNVVRGGNSGITTICCVISQKSADLIYLATEA
jgi:hypothetical protein